MSAERIANEFATKPRHEARASLPSIGLAVVAAWLAFPVGPAFGRSVNTLTKIEADELDSITRVRIVGSSAPRYSVVRAQNPARLRIDLSNCKLGGVSALTDVGSASVRQIAANQFDGDRASTVRVTIGLQSGAHYSVRTEGHVVVVSLNANASALAPERPDQTPLAVSKTRQAPKGQARARVGEIEFVDRASRSEVVVQLDRVTHYELDRADGQPLLRLPDATLPERLRRKLDTSAFPSPVVAVSSHPCGVKSLPPGTCLRLALRNDAPYRVERRGTAIVWQVVKPQVSPGQADGVGAQAHTYSFKGPKVAAGGAGLRQRKGRRYAGRRIDLDFKDADIHNILRLLSDVGSVNIITSDAVAGKVTIRMKDVPWDQALDVILRAKGMGQVREGNLIRVAPLADLEKEREAEIARQKQIMLLQTLETRLIPLSYAQADQVLTKLQYTLSPRGKVTYDERTNMVIARDVPSNLDLLERMIRNLDTQTPQVMIESRIVEARTNYTRAIGVQWGGAFTASSATGNSTGLAFPNQVGIGGGTDDPNSPTQGILLGQSANPNFAVNMPAATGLNSGGALGLSLGSVSGAFNVNLRLSAAESTGDIRIISAPKVTTLDNVEAKIEQGVSIPFSQVSANGVQTQFRDAKLSLMVRPHVTADGSIVMKIKVERNEPDFVNTGARGDPTILKKEAETELLVKDGDTAVIGGIYTTRDGQSWQKVPWFADIPILGWLFKTRRDTSDREEVLVFITPRIINRAQSIGR